MVPPPLGRAFCWLRMTSGGLPRQAPAPAMGTTPEPGVSLVDQGLDSVAIVELRNLLQTRLGVADLSVEAIMEDPTVEGLTKRLARSLADAPGLAALPSSVPTRAQRLAEPQSPMQLAGLL